MAQVNVSKQITAPQDAVWAVLSNPSRFPEWLTIHEKWKDEPPTELSQGATFTQVVSVMGMANTIAWTTDEYDAPNSLRISGTGMAGAKISFVLAVAADGPASVATIDAEFTGQMVVGAIGAAIERSAAKEVEASLEKLAALAG